ncbi:hypothetical protein BDF20DRAFT_908960 [Mycotypha africana]|uniref:uncharacterized protein n=1 Tax=Mycotypha africana TaxID=64632 RepID=UPI002301C75C|nr:uncharacterized protein BDF20DRAFT_908960 [Mycotypha africana]KAI8991158.1 hypothetical protein BDF20DRAFT_908960 [Mycotypha africana]
MTFTTRQCRTKLYSPTDSFKAVITLIRDNTTNDNKPKGVKTSFNGVSMEIYPKDDIFIKFASEEVLYKNLTFALCPAPFEKAIAQLLSDSFMVSRGELLHIIVVYYTQIWVTISHRSPRRKGVYWVTRVLPRHISNNANMVPLLSRRGSYEV